MCQWRVKKKHPKCSHYQSRNTVVYCQTESSTEKRRSEELQQQRKSDHMIIRPSVVDNKQIINNTQYTCHSIHKRRSNSVSSWGHVNSTLDKWMLEWNFGGGGEDCKLRTSRGDGFTGTDSTAGSQERASERQSLVKGCELYILCQCLGQRSTHLINQKCAKERARARARETGRERFIFRPLYLSKHYDAGSGLVSFSA